MSSHREVTARIAAGRAAEAEVHRAHWAGRAMTGLAVLFLLFDGVIKLLHLPPVETSFVRLGYAPEVAIGIGVLELVCVGLHLLPPTSILGALLITAYLGGAVATHVRIGDPLASHVLFPVYVALLIWGGLYLRERRVRALLPLRGTR